MNRVLIKDFFIEVFKTRKRFLSILLIVALGCGFFVGIQITGSDMKHTLDTYFDDTDYLDVQVIAGFGLSETDKQAILDAPGVKTADFGYQMDTILTFGETNTVARFHSYSEDDFMEQFSLVSGRLPENPGECLLEDLKNSNQERPGLGDTVTIASGKENRDINDFFHRDHFTVVGTIHSPHYFSTQKGNTNIGSGKLGTYVFVPESEFDMSAYVTASVYGVESTDTYSPEYEAEAKALSDILEEISKVRSPIRYGELEDELTEAQETLLEEKTKGEDKIAEAKEELAEAREDLAQGEKDYDQGVIDFYTEIVDAETELADAKEKLKDGRVEYEDGVETFRTEIADAKAELADAKSKLEDGEEEYLKGRREYLEGYDEYRENEILFQEMAGAGKQELAAGRLELEESKKLLDDSRKTLDESKEQLEQGKVLLEENRKELEQGQEELNQGKQELSGLRQFIGQMEYVKNHAAQLDPAAAEAIISAATSYDEQLGQLVAGYIQAAQAGSVPPLLVMAMDLAIQELRDTADGISQQIDEAQQEIDQGREQLDKAQEEFDKNYALYQAGEEEYAAGLAAWEAGLAKIEAGEKELTDGANQLSAAHNQLVDADNLLVKARTTLDDGWTEYEDGLIELEDATIEGQQELDDALAELEEGEADYRQGLIDLEEGRLEGLQELADAREEIEDGKIKITDGEKEVRDGEIELVETIEKHQKDIDDAREVLDEIVEISWSITSRDQLFHVNDYGVNTERVDAIAKVFPAFFVAIAALVSLTTMTRMVEDQRTEVGTLKSLGYSNAAIIFKFIAYAFLAAVLGAVIGLAISMQVFPRIIYHAFTSMLYILPPLIIRPHWELVIPTIFAAIATTTVSTLLATSNLLKEQPAQLLRPAAPMPGKRILLERITPLWKRLSFNRKVTFRNLFRYKRRMLMSVVGIAGCTALMLAGFGLRDAIGGFVGAQFDEVVLYDMEVIYDEDKHPEDDFLLVSQADGVESTAEIYVQNAEVLPQGNFNTVQDASLTVLPEGQDLSEMLVLQDVDNGEDLALNAHGAIITEKLATLYDLTPGDIFTIEVDNQAYAIEVGGITKNYLFHYIYLSESYYQELFRQSPVPNRQYVRLNEEILQDAEAVDQLTESLLRPDSILTIMLTSAVVDSTQDLMASLDTIVYVLIVAAGLLAFIVMYNLTNINITERRREIATLKVLGFYDRETSDYILSENTLLSMIGAMFGLLFGIWLSRFIVSVAEVDNMLFLKTIRPQSFLYALALTTIFTFIVRVVAHFQLKKIDMVESLQSIE